jgi:chromosome segregation ATPase
MTGKHLSLDQTDKKQSKGLFSKMRSYQALSKDFDEIMRARAKLEDLSQAKSELVIHIEELTQKLNKLKSTYDSKKLKMVEGLKEQTTHMIKKQKDIMNAKVKKVKNKLERLQQKADMIYASKQEHFAKKERIKKMTKAERNDFYKSLCVDAGVTYDGQFYRVVCQNCHQLGRIRPSEAAYLDPRGMPCEACQCFTFIPEYQRDVWSQL